MVRKRADEDLTQLRSQLATAGTKVRQQGDRDVDTVATLQALRQEIDTIQRGLSDKEQTLRVSQSQCRSLEDAIEDRDKEIDQLRHKLQLLLSNTSDLSVSSEMSPSQFQELSARPQAESEQVTLPLSERLTREAKETESENQRTPLTELLRNR